MITNTCVSGCLPRAPVGHAPITEHAPRRGQHTTEGEYVRQALEGPLGNPGPPTNDMPSKAGPGQKLVPRRPECGARHRVWRATCNGKAWPAPRPGQQNS